MVGSAQRTVDIIIPCRNEEECIGKCLDSIVAQDYPKDCLNVFIIDGMSEDGTRKIVQDRIKRHSSFRLLDNHKRVIPSAMNIGLKHSTGNTIMKIDSHAMYPPDYVSKCVKFLEDYSADNVGGTIIPIAREDTRIGRAIVRVLSHPFGVGNSRFRLGCNEPMWADTVFSGCYRREVFDMLGAYDENIARSEDVAINSRLRSAGGKILLAPEISSYYYARSRFKDFCRHNFDNGFWVTYPLAFGRMLFSWRHLTPLAFILSLSGLLVLWSISGPASSICLWLFLTLVAIYSTCAFVFSVDIALKEQRKEYLLTIPAIFGLLHFSYGLGALWGLLKTIVEVPFRSKKADINNEPMRNRKEAEADLHDYLRISPSGNVRYASNEKLYSICDSNKDYIKAWLASRCKGKRVLDYCCGNGTFSVWLAKAGAEAHGVDISPVSIENAKRLTALERVDDRIEFHLADAEATGFEDNYFDLAIVNGALHHLDLKSAYCELARILKPDGQVICTEALRHNRLIQLYRKLTPHLRSAWEVEHILGRSDVYMARRFFNGAKVERFFHLTSIAAVPFQNTRFFLPLLKMLGIIDSIILRLPVLRWQAWMAVFVLSNPKKESKDLAEDFQNTMRDHLKRVFDVICSLTGIVVLSPVLILSAILVKLDSEGPVFYKGVRIGENGVPFKIYKFRTMVVNAEKLGASSTREDDPRVTKAGRYLRRYKLDELPQLINVLKGEMSLVGPRPQVPWAVELYSEKEERLLKVKPGVTDYASIRFRNEPEILRGSKDPDKDYLEKIAPEKTRLGLEYIDERSLWTDVKIIALTIKAIVQKNRMREML